MNATSAALSNLNLKQDKRDHHEPTNGTSSNTTNTANGTSAAAKAAALNSNHHSSSSNNNHHHQQQQSSGGASTVTDSNKLLHSSDRANSVEYHRAAAAAAAAEKAQAQVNFATVVRPKVKEIDGYVGFASLPDQVYRKAVKKGFEFTLMVVGESGLGKSTLINSMFLSDIYNQEQYPGPSHRIKKTVAVETTKVMLKENGVNLTLTVVDTPGFGDAVDNSNW